MKILQKYALFYCWAQSQVLMVHIIGQLKRMSLTPHPRAMRVIKTINLSRALNKKTKI